MSQTNRKELEKILEQVLMKHHDDISQQDDDAITEAVQAILDAGYVRLSDVKLDEEKIEEVLRSHQGGLELHIATQQGFNKLAHALIGKIKKPEPKPEIEELDFSGLSYKKEDIELVSKINEIIRFLREK